jgi:hypothetical protein
MSVLRERALLSPAVLCAFFFLHQNPGPPAIQAPLDAILKKAADYCQRLEKAALDFVCLEEVTEASAHFTPAVNVYLYDYQFIRKKGETQERRNLLRVNGKKANVKDSALHGVAFQYENVLFGPVGLLSRFWQTYHDYRLVGEETIKGKKVAVIEVTPASVSLEPHCYGRAWVEEDDGGVAKIVWDQKSLGNYPAVEEWARSHGSELRITSFSEYELEKNGLRFPSRNFSEQAYIDAEKRTIVAARISVVYRNYKFFTVESEVTY